MTLATVPRYRPGRLADVGEHAVVVGGGIAGLCAARVLADGFDRVTVLEYDELGDDLSPRRGVPQGRHVHVLIEAGRVTLADLFGGFSEALLSAGGVAFDVSHDFEFYIEGGILANSPRRRPGYSATRPLFEAVVRRQLASLEGVDIRSGTRCSNYTTDDVGRRVTGVQIDTGPGDDEELPADLVVDATGRTSRTPAWLEAHGYPAPPVDEVTIDMAYSTTFLDRPPHDRRGIAIAPDPDQPRGGVVMPVEDDRWVMTLWGMHDAVPPTDPAGFEAYTEQLPVPNLHRLLETHAWGRDDITHYPFPSNRRYRYESLDRFPEGLVVIGDAVASFNPIYGQGMSVAALEAVSLHHALAEDGLDDLASRFFARAAETVDTAWKMAVGRDHQFPETRGPRPPAIGLMNRYLARLLRRAHTDPELFDAFYRVQTMELPPRHLLSPDVIWRVYKPRV